MPDPTVATLIARLAAEPCPGLRWPVLTELASLTAEPRAAAELNDPTLVRSLLESLVHEATSDGGDGSRLREIRGLYQLVLSRAGAASETALRELLAGPPSRLARVGSAFAGPKLTALALLDSHWRAEDAELLAGLVRSSREPLAVRHLAGRLWHRLAGEAAALDLARLALLSLPEDPTERLVWSLVLRDPLRSGLDQLAPAGGAREDGLAAAVRQSLDQCEAECPALADAVGRLVADDAAALARLARAAAEPLRLRDAAAWVWFRLAGPAVAADVLQVALSGPLSHSRDERAVHYASLGGSLAEPLARALASDSQDTRLRARHLLEALGAPAVGTLAELVRTSTHWQAREHAEEVLLAVDPAALEAARRLRVSDGRTLSPARPPDGSPERGLSRTREAGDG